MNSKMLGVRRAGSILGWIAGFAVALILSACDQAADKSGGAGAGGNNYAQGGNGTSKGNGTVQPYSLLVQAMQDVNLVTDVTLTVNVTSNGFSPPDQAQHIQLKSLDASGEVRWTKNANDVALSPDPTNGSSAVTTSYSDMIRGQPVQAHVQIHNSETVDTKVLKAAGAVKLRPDIAVESVSAPETAVVGQLINVVAHLRELNGDLGALSDVVLRQDANTLDSVPAVALTAASTADVMLAVSFSEPGTYELVASAENVNPGDYDGSNNSASATITVASSVQPASYYMYYNNYDYRYWSEQDNPYWYSSYENRSYWEYFYENLNFPSTFEFPGKATMEVYSAGNLLASYDVPNIPSTWEYSDGCYDYAYGWVLPNTSTQVYLQSYRDCYGNASGFAQFYHSSSEYFYRSSYLDKIYGGGYSNSWTSGYDTPWNVHGPLSTRFVVEAGGQSWGGSAGMTNWYEYPYDSSWNYPDGYGGYYRGQYSYYYSYGYGYGMTSP